MRGERRRAVAERVPSRFAPWIILAAGLAVAAWAGKTAAASPGTAFLGGAALGLLAVGAAYGVPRGRRLVLAWGPTAVAALLVLFAGFAPLEVTRLGGFLAGGAGIGTLLAGLIVEVAEEGPEVD